MVVVKDIITGTKAVQRGPWCNCCCLVFPFVVAFVTMEAALCLRGVQLRTDCFLVIREKYFRVVPTMTICFPQDRPVVYLDYEIKNKKSVFIQILSGLV